MPSIALFGSWPYYGQSLPAFRGPGAFCTLSGLVSIGSSRSYECASCTIRRFSASEICQGRSFGDPSVYLKAGVIQNGCFERNEEGVPQGGPLSPLLGNVMLNELDKELERRGHEFVRYADDMLIFCKSLRAAERQWSTSSLLSQTSCS